MSVKCSGCGKQMEFIRKNCPYCGSSIRNWIFQFILQSIVIIGIIAISIAIPMSIIIKIVITLILGTIYVAQIRILIKDKN